MTDIDFQNKTKALIDNLKSISANYGLGNNGNEFNPICSTAKTKAIFPNCLTIP